ncbi:hypothetical protein BDW59DRAFT_150500 [Aspergillus cavernicola]|uniref:Fungal-type protein kinase domain-containing protein n=1 Tax=Aspergillus cavernicola TaxID=176166 RepID=A0ABR4HZJ5_9EURO
MVVYTEMNGKELGINTFIKRDEHGHTIVHLGENQADAEILYLDDQSIAFTPDLVCTGTTAYRAKRVESSERGSLVKLTWRADDGRREEDMLKLTKERKTSGVIQLFRNQDLNSITNLR